MTPRLSEIAAQAGVSQATVSRVLNGRPGVSAASRQAVVTALDVLGYERPAPLRRISHSGLIGLITPELSNPIFPAIAQVIQTALISHGYASVLCTHEMGGITEDDYTELLLERGVSGIVFVSGMHADSRADPKRYQRLIERRLPIVLVNGYVPGIPAPFVSTDDGAAAELAVNHLRALGHRRIGLAAGQERFVPVIRKIEGYRRAMAGVLEPAELDRLVMPTLFTVEGGHAAARALLDEGCTAICCASDLMALGAFRAVRERGLRVPEDVSVVGFDDAPLMAYTDPPLTTVRQATRDLALAAVQALLDAIAGAETPRGEYLFQPELVVRNSTAPAV